MQVLTMAIASTCVIVLAVRIRAHPINQGD